MKININDRIGQASFNSNFSKNNIISRKTEIADSGNDLNTLSRYRNMIEALNLAQIASSLLSQALTASAQIRNSAMSELTTGSNPESEINNQLALIKNSVEIAGGALAGSNINISLNIPNAVDTGKELIDISKKISTDGNNTQLKEIDPNLDKINKSLEASIKAISMSIGIKSSPAILDPVSAETLSSKAIDDIKSKPQIALATQGNITNNMLTLLI